MPWITIECHHDRGHQRPADILAAALDGTGVGLDALAEGERDPTSSPNIALWHWYIDSGNEAYRLQRKLISQRLYDLHDACQLHAFFT